MANSFKGKIEAIEGIQSIVREGKAPFEKRRMVLDATRFDGLTGERGFEKHVCFEFSGRNVHVPDEFKVGDIVEVFFDVDSQLVTKKDGTKDYFTRVSGYRITGLSVPHRTDAPVAADGAATAPQTQSAPSGVEEGLPF